MTADAPLPVAVVIPALAAASVATPPDVDSSMDVEMEQSDVEAKAAAKDSSGLPQRGRSAKSRIKKEATRHQEGGIKKNQKRRTGNGLVRKYV